MAAHEVDWNGVWWLKGAPSKKGGSFDFSLTGPQSVDSGQPTISQNSPVFRPNPRVHNS